MSLIYETTDFIVEAPVRPLVTRADGGHITITPKIRLADRSQLSPRLAIELMYLTMLIGEAMTAGLISRGIDIGRINYQDNGNWGVLPNLYQRVDKTILWQSVKICYLKTYQAILVSK
jgi:hypothetical protein